MSIAPTNLETTADRPPARGFEWVHGSQARLLLGVAALLGFSVLFWRNAWISDDAQITFRSLEQLFGGQGPRWNPHERVQTFTHPLWYGLLAVVRCFHSDLFRGALLASFACSTVALLAATRRFEWELERGVVLVALLVCSKSYVDYTSSGLENPLSALLVVLFASSANSGTTSTPSFATLRRLALLSALLGLARLDLLLLALPTLACEASRLFRSSGARPVLGALTLGFLPLSGWLAFATIYYGSPFPNTALAKLGTGVAAWSLWDKGIDYLLYHARFDPVTVALLGTWAIVLSRSAARRPLLIGAALYTAYLTRIGGDFMAGRLLQPLVVLATVEFVALAPQRSLRGVSAGVLVATLFIPGSPPWSDGVSRGGAKLDPKRGDVGNEKANYFDGWSLRRPAYFDESRPRPGHSGVSIAQMIGRRGYNASLDSRIVDEYALADPFLARLPAKADSRIGHFRRVIPAGYIESLEVGSNRLADSTLRVLYDRVALATRAPIWSFDRWRAIFQLHFLPLDLSSADLSAFRLEVIEQNPDFVAFEPARGGHVDSVRVARDRVRFEGWLPVRIFEPGASFLVTLPARPKAVRAESVFRHFDEKGSTLTHPEQRTGFRLQIEVGDESRAEVARATCLFVSSGSGPIEALGRTDGGCPTPKLPRGRFGGDR